MFDLTWMQGVQVLSAALTVIIAFFGGWIAYQQMRTNREALKEKLFDRRFQIFKSVQHFLTRVMQDGKLDDDSLPQFNDALQRARFFFGKDVNDYLDSIRTRSFEMKKFDRLANVARSQEDRIENIELEERELVWLTEQLSVIFDKFQPYLGFTNQK